jgi:single-stranded-DNA-specific exonuclease
VSESPETTSLAAADAWRLAAPPDEAATRELAQELALPAAIARLLQIRGYAHRCGSTRLSAPDARTTARSVSYPRHAGCSGARLRAALAAGEPVLIYGDYDVDGTVATVLLKTAAERAAAAMGVAADIRYHIPHRIREGYGMQESRIEAAAAEGVRLVISVDTGIRAFAAAEEAQRVGLDLIVTDHHLPEGTGVPDAVAVLNPNQPGCEYPCKHLCGAGVAFKLAQALLESTAIDDAERKALREKTLPSFFKLLAIATIADAVPLTGENRIIASLGLRELRHPSQAGLRALMDLAQIDTSRSISAMDIGFRLAPRINAAGRMDVANDVVELFLTRDAAVAATLAAKLHRLNDERRASEADALRAIEALIAALAASAAGLPACLVLDDSQPSTEARIDERVASRRDWHSGIASGGPHRTAGTRSSPMRTARLTARDVLSRTFPSSTRSARSKPKAGIPSSPASEAMRTPWGSRSLGTRTGATRDGCCYYATSHAGDQSLAGPGRVRRRAAAG